MRRTRWLLVVLALLAPACGSDGGGDAPEGSIRVPDDAGSIQEAVDMAESGGLILIEPGVYEEAVAVETPDLVIRGLDRDEVVLDGGFERGNGFQVFADGVAVENLTVQNYAANGVYWDHVDGYRGSYLTSIRNGDYGLYAFGSVNGLFEHSFASGSPDAGFYIGQCNPCHAVIDDVVAEWNGLGYSGTNAGGDLTIVNSEWRENRAGIVPNSGAYEGCAPQQGSTIVGNFVHDNNNGETSAIEIAQSAIGNGVLVAGGQDNVIERNRVVDHDLGGIVLAPLPEDDPETELILDPPENCVEDVQPAPEGEAPASIIWPSSGNRVAANVTTDGGLGGIVVIVGPNDENCATDNEVSASSPADIETVMPCDGPVQTFAPDIAGYLAAAEQLQEGTEPTDFQDVELPDPGDQPDMPDAESAPATPAGAPPAVDVDAIEVPPEG